MGEIKLSLTSFQPGVVVDEWFPLKPKTRKQKVSGDLHLEISWKLKDQ